MQTYHSPFASGNSVNRRKRTALTRVVHKIISPPTHPPLDAPRYLDSEIGDQKDDAESKRRRVCPFDINQSKNSAPEVPEKSFAVQVPDEIMSDDIKGVMQLGEKKSWWKEPTMICSSDETFSANVVSPACCTICLFSCSNSTGSDDPLRYNRSATSSSNSESGQQKQKSLLHYFSSSSLAPLKRKPQLPFQNTSKQKQLSTCTHCDRTVCIYYSDTTSQQCAIVCQQCCRIFCSTSCSTINYSESFERAYCLDCNTRILMEEEKHSENVYSKGRNDGDVMMID